MVFNATFNTILVLLWRSILLVEETGVPRENHRPVASHWHTLSHNVVSSIPCHELDSIYNWFHRHASYILLQKYLPGSPPSGMGDFSRFWLSCLGPLVWLLLKTFKSYGFAIVCLWVYLLFKGYSRNSPYVLN